MFQPLTITRFSRPYTHYCRLGNLVKGKFIYKYMPLSTAKLCLASNSLRFREPSEWDDPFERLYYTADYSNLNPDLRFNTKLFACCLTNKPNSEAAWRIYTKKYEEDPCVQFKIYIGQFRQAIDRFIKESKANIYEGKVMYDLSEYQLLHLYQKSNNLYPIFFDGFELDKYLNLMLLKRPHFAYENEIRFFIHNYTSQKKFLDVKIP